MLNTGQLAPLSSRPSPGRHASPPSYLTGVPASYSPLHGLTTRAWWMEQTMNPMLALRSLRANDRWEAFWH